MFVLLDFLHIELTAVSVQTYYDAFLLASYYCQIFRHAFFQSAAPPTAEPPRRFLSGSFMRAFFTPHAFLCKSSCFHAN